LQKGYFKVKQFKFINSNSFDTNSAEFIKNNIFVQGHFVNRSFCQLIIEMTDQLNAHSIKGLFIEITIQ